MLKNNARVHVFVKDLDGNPKKNSTVIVRFDQKDGEEQQINYNESFEKFISKGLNPGKYKIEVRDKNGLEEDRTVNLKTGDNYLFFTLAEAGTPFYLAAGGEKVYIKKNEDQKLLFARGEALHQKLPAILKKIGITIGKEVIPFEKNKQFDVGAFFLNTPKTDDKKRKFLKRILRVLKNEFPKEKLRGQLAVSMNRGKNKLEGLTNEIKVKFKAGIDKEQIEMIAKKYGFEVVQKINYLENTYLFRLNEIPNFGLLKTALKLDEEDSIIYAEPNIIFQIEPDSEIPVHEPNDFLYREQTFYQLIKAPEAWAELGNGGDREITVAIIDTGAVDPRHPDIKGKLIANYDFVEGIHLTEENFKRELRNNSHGTQCASIAAGASDNNAGAVGLAGNCSLIGARISGSLEIDEVAKVWLWAAGLETDGAEIPPKGADVISNSWNWRTPNMRSLEDVAEKITREGRGGKGCVICFSISNDGYKNFETDHSYLCNDKMLKVGASINLNPTSLIPDCRDEIPEGQTICEDTRALYSPFGHALDIVAPSSTAVSLENKDIDPVLSAVIKNKGDMIGPEIVRGKNPTILNKEIKGNSTEQVEIEVENTDAFKPGISVMIGDLEDELYEIKVVDSVKTDDTEKRQLLCISGIDNDYKSKTKIYGGDSNYSKQFGGTSHACAVIAGAAALLLSANPELSWWEVKEILCKTAVQIDAEQINETGKWEEIGGKMFSPWYGYGRLDIYAAVKEAKVHAKDTKIANKTSV